MTSRPQRDIDATNQSPVFVDLNLFARDVALQAALAREGGAAAVDNLTKFGALCGSAEAQEWGRLANENPPKLKTYDAKGFRSDQIEFHPAYHALMAASMAQGLHCSTWDHLAQPGTKPQPASNVIRCAGSYLATQMEAGHGCPITMTNAAVPTLLLEPSLAAQWVPKILDRRYDSRFVPMSRKAAVTIGMGMTEKQGGTDVRANTTRADAQATRGSGHPYSITGHKWFMSAPMCDAFLVLAQTQGGLSCFLLPRFLPDGSVNALRFQRLKDKLGNRSNASSEVEFVGATGFLVGEEGRGVPAIIEMVTATRLDCAIGSAGLMRFAVSNAVHHARHRSVFQRRLIDQPLMQHVLADLALDVEAATALALRLARSFDHPEDALEAAWRRVMTPVTKYWVCKMAPAVVNEALECLGGNGYVEEGSLARVYREAPLNAIWEGSGNVMALDLLRVLARDRDDLALIMDDLARRSAAIPTLRNEFERVHAMLADPAHMEMRGRELIGGLAQLAAGLMLAEHAPHAVADAFIGARLAGGGGRLYGQGLSRADTRAIVDRAFAA
jgi:putative acyl-CoA dehydrogenase